MRVLHIVKVSTGATWVLHQVRVLRDLGIDVVVAQPSATEGNAPRFRELGAEVIAADVDFPATRPWRLPGVLRRCRQLVAAVRPDIIHTHHVGTTYIARMALGKRHPIPRVFQVAGPLHLEHWPYRAADLHLAGPRDFWIGTCHWTHDEYLRRGVPAQRVFLTFAGADMRPFRTERSGKLRGQLGIANGTPLVGIVALMYAPKRYLGQRHGLKGHEDFFEAFRLVHERNPRVRGVVVGGAWGGAEWYERRLRDLGEQVCGDALTFTGFRSDIAEIYPDLDLAVVASHSENLGGAAEPLLSGVPVVATRVGGLPDIVRDGETGWLVPPRDPRALAEAIHDVLAHPDEARRRTEKGAALVRDLLDAERTGREVAAFYEKILSATR